MTRLLAYFIATLCISNLVLCDYDLCVREPDSYCSHETCALPLYDPHVGVPCQCTPENIGHRFGACVNGFRDIIYFWRPPATCLNGTLPFPVSGIPCDLQCGTGYYLDVVNKTCTPCDPGSVSFGTGHKFDDWNDWTGQFSTHCAIGDITKTCASWVLAGETINSGDNHLLNYLESVLEYRTQLLVPGWVAFKYQVNAEQYYDGLYFIVDDLSYFFISNTADWVVYNLSLSIGYHTIQWKYYKDRLLTVGRDRADIDWIQINGVTLGATECELCPAGHSQPDFGQTDCIPCTPGTYNPNPGASKCLPCGAGKNSFAGAITCFNELSCSEMQPYFYTSYYTPCIDGQRTLVYDWIYPLACSNPANATLPPNQTLSCVPDACKPGQSRSSPNSPCVYCDAGYYSPDGSPCSPCAKGTAGENRIRYFDDWVSWPKEENFQFSTGCIGDDCYTPGWRLAHNYIDSGVGHGQGVLSYVDMSFNIYSGASLSFNYSLPCSSGSELTFSLNDFILQSFTCSNTCNDVPRTWNITFRNFFFSDASSNQTFTLRIGFSKHTDDSIGCDRAIIYNVKLTGAAQGPAGAAGCIKCKQGSYAADEVATAHCTACSPGYGGGTTDGQNCILCQDGYFSDNPGSSCLGCGNNTLTDNTRTQCNFNCSEVSFSTPGSVEPLVYNISAIGFWNATIRSPSANATLEYHFEGGACGWTPSCLDRRGLPMHAYLCYHNSSFFTVNMGKSPSISELSPRGGIRFDYSYGSQFPWGGRSCDSSVMYRCDSEEELTEGKLASTSSINDLNTLCHVELVFNSKYACPKCRAIDFAYFDTECYQGKKMRSYYVKTSYCYGGATLPAPQEMDCGAEVTVRTTTIVIAVVLAFAIFSGAAVGLVVLYLRNKKLHHDYNMLVNTNVPLDTRESSDDNTARQ